jgi:hypothetical protein
LRPQSGSVFGAELKHEVAGESPGVALDLLIEPLGSHAVKRGKLSVHNYALPAQQDNRLCDALNRRDTATLCHMS